MELDEFARTSATTTDGDGFRLENNRLLDVPVDGTVMVKAGSMVAYTGDMTFTGKASAEGGLTGFVKEAVSSEGTPGGSSTAHKYPVRRSGRVAGYSPSPSIRRIVAVTPRGAG